MYGSQVGTLLLLLLQTVAALPAPPVNDVVATVSKNVSDFNELVPDFICTEKIDSSRSEGGKVQERKTVESLFSESRQRGEQREITAIDGKPAKKNAKMPNLPTNWNGAFSGLLNMTFSSKNLEFYNYSLGSKPSEPGRIVLQFETKKDQTYVKWTLNGETAPAADTGEALLDPGSMQIVHTERHFLNLPRSLIRLNLTADYGPVTIDEKQFWLPKLFRAEGGNPNQGKTRTFLYTAEFANCRKFGSEIRLIPQ
jgi:hypothetical protein